MLTDLSLCVVVVIYRARSFQKILPTLSFYVTSYVYGYKMVQIAGYSLLMCVSSYV